MKKQSLILISFIFLLNTFSHSTEINAAIGKAKVIDGETIVINGEKIRFGWALDKNGEPTADPEAALEGSLVSSGGYKGWGFGLMAEVLAAGLAGGLASQFVQPLKAKDGEPHNLGQYYILIDPHNAPALENLLNDLETAVSKDEGTRLPGQGKVAEEFVVVPDDLLVLLEKLTGLKWKD